LVVQVVKQPNKQLMAIPSVMQGLIEVDGGKVFELDSPRGAAWVESIGSFRYEPSGDSKAYTVRKEPSGYWYGCRKIAGTVRKKYIGKTSEISTAKLDEIAVALEDAPPPVSRVKKVAQVAQKVVQVAEVAQDRLATLESEVAMLRQAVQALQEALPGKSEAGDSKELPKVVDNEVAEQLQNQLSNLKEENEKLKQELVDARADYAKLLESSAVVADNLRRGVRELQARLEVERADREEVEARLVDREKQIEELRSQLETEQTRREGIWEELTDIRQAFEAIRSERSELKKTCAELRSELSDLKQKSAAASKDLPEEADLLNQMKSKRKKSKTDLADLEAILEILEN
jgi:DNA repair exonuclease SbcCD ATPase subunit